MRTKSGTESNIVGILGFIFQYLMSIYLALAVFGLCGMFNSLRQNQHVLFSRVKAEKYGQNLKKVY